MFQRTCLAQYMFCKLAEFSVVKRPDMTVHKAFFSALMRAAGVPRRLQNRRANMFARAAETLQRAYVIDLLFRRPGVGPHVGLPFDLRPLLGVEAAGVPTEETCIFVASLMCRYLFNPIEAGVQAVLHHLYKTEAKLLDRWYAVDATGVRRGCLLIPGSAGMTWSARVEARFGV